MKKLHIILLGAAAMLSIGASAQSFRSGYFLDNYTYGYRINPAQVNDRSFAAIGLGNIDLFNTTNIGVSSILLPNKEKDGLVTGFSGQYTADEFLGGLHKDNFLDMNESINLLTIGISNGKRMHTVELNVNSSIRANLPRDLFALAKVGGNHSYDLSNLGLNAAVVADLSYGYSMYITESLSIGARLHLLAGGANVGLSCNGAAISLEGNPSISPNLEVVAAGVPQITAEDIQNIIDNPNAAYALNTKSPIGGYGAALDLGAELHLPVGLDAMVSVTNIGAIAWKFTGIKSSGNINVRTDLLSKIKIGEDTPEIGIDDIVDMSGWKDEAVPAGTTRTSMTPFNIAAGARYYMPFYKGLSVGFLGTYHMVPDASYASWYDLRLGATITPARIISATGNIGYGTFGPNFGGALNLHLGPINLHAGLDGYMGKIGKIKNISFPTGSLMTDVHVGLSLTFGRPKK